MKLSVTTYKITQEFSLQLMSCEVRERERFARVCVYIYIYVRERERGGRTRVGRGGGKDTCGEYWLTMTGVVEGIMTEASRSREKQLIN